MINRLIEKIQKTNAPIVVGLDPMLKYVPQHIKKAAYAENHIHAQRRRYNYN